MPACRLEDLGDASFKNDHGLRYALMSGAMANGIGSVEIVESMGKSGFLGIFGSAGLSLSAVEQAIDRIQSWTGDSIPYGMNLIHSPGEPEMEAAVVDLYLRRGVRLVEASAFLNLTLPVVRYRVAGLRRDGSGNIVAANRMIAKVSRVEVASKFMAPPPPQILRELVASGEVSAEQAEWAARIPIADDITAEADSGGHTDNQPAIVLLPTMLTLRDRMPGDARLRSPAPRRRGRRHLDSVVGGRRPGDGGGLPRDRIGQPVVRRGRNFRRGPEYARAGTAGRHRDGPRGRHVRDGRKSPGAQARHVVCHACRQAL